MLFKFFENKIGDSSYINTKSITTVRAYGVEKKVIIKYQPEKGDEKISLVFESQEEMSEFLDRLEKAME